MKKQMKTAQVSESPALTRLLDAIRGMGRGLADVRSARLSRSVGESIANAALRNHGHEVTIMPWVSEAEAWEEAEWLSGVGA